MSVGWSCPGVNHQPDCIGHNGKDGKHPTPCRTQGDPKTAAAAVRVAKKEQQKLQEGASE